MNSLQRFGSFGCYGEVRLDDLHRVVVSYRPTLKAKARTETQAGEIHLEIQALWWCLITLIIWASEGQNIH